MLLAWEAGREYQQRVGRKLCMAVITQILAMGSLKQGRTAFRVLHGVVIESHQAIHSLPSTDVERGRVYGCGTELCSHKMVADSVCDRARGGSIPSQQRDSIVPTREGKAAVGAGDGQEEGREVLKLGGEGEE